jgi:hypothetical protein
MGWHVDLNMILYGLMFSSAGFIGGSLGWLMVFQFVGFAFKT